MVNKIKAVTAEFGVEGRDVVTGYASVFGVVDSERDMTMPGAFKKAIQEQGARVRALWQHDRKEPVGLPRRLTEDDRGLYTETKISMTETGEKLLILIKDGVITEMSMNIIPIKEEYDTARRVNMLREVSFIEYSYVTFAANPAARIEQLKALANEYRYSKGNALDVLRDDIIKALKAQREPEPSTRSRHTEPLMEQDIRELVKRLKEG